MTLLVLSPRAGAWGSGRWGRGGRVAMGGAVLMMWLIVLVVMVGVMVDCVWYHYCSP